MDFPALGKQGNNRDKVGQRGGRDTDDWMSCVSAASTMLALIRTGDPALQYSVWPAKETWRLATILAAVKLVIFAFLGCWGTSEIYLC